MDIIVAIELGSSKITGIAGRRESNGEINVLAYATEKSASSVRKGVVYNIDKTVQSLTTIIDKLQREMKGTISRVYVGVGGQSLHTVKNVIPRELIGDSIVPEELIDSICEENREMSLAEMEILDVAPQEYKIDDHKKEAGSPVGIVATHIEGCFLNIVGRVTLRKNIERCFGKARIEIADDLIVAPLAAAAGLLTEKERCSGCALVDIGADTTTISIYKNKLLRFLAVLPLGSANITQDITTLHLEEEEVEQLKIKQGDALYENGNEDEPKTCLSEGGQSIKLSELNNAIGARAEEIVVNVLHQIELAGYEGKLLEGIVLTGGGANLKNMDKLFFEKSNKLFPEKSKIGIKVANTFHLPINTGDRVKQDGTQYTILGLLSAGRENCGKIEEEVKPLLPKSDLFGDNDFFKKPEEKTKAQKKEEEAERKARDKAEKEKKEKERKKNKGPGLFDKINKIKDALLSDEEMK
jgi:cell division protein FtsA